MPKKLTTSEVIIKCKQIHGNKYDYSKVEYINSITKINIICPEHGEFLQLYHDHIKTGGCSICSGTGKLSTKHFIDKALKIHGNKYDYSKVEYINNESKVIIKCPLHDSFLQSPHDHLSGKGCPACGRLASSISHLHNNNIFIDKALKIHGNRFVYCSQYVNQHTKIEIRCKIHGIFFQKPKYHLQGNGCPICKESKGEREVRNFLIKNKITYESQYSFSDCKNMNKLSFDFYLPAKNICIEFDGRQHFEVIEKWGGEKTFKDIQKRDKIKNEYCKDKQIELIRIKYCDNIFEVLEKSSIFTNKK